MRIPKLNILKINLVILVAVILSTCSASPLQATASPTKSLANARGETSIAEVTPTVYLPLVLTPQYKFFGIYIKQYWNEQNVKTYMPLADQWAGKKHTSVGWFINFDDDAFTKPVTELPKNNLYRQLENLWQSGYVSFINLASSNATAAQIANGAIDTEINYAAEFYSDWLALGGGRRAFIAPLQEMNGNWVSYGRDPDNFKKAYRHILDIFAQKGITRSQVWWVFAPNRWTDPVKEFDVYYPGDDVVDFISFSSYNYGFCPDTVKVSAWWGSYQKVFQPFIDHIQTIAPSKKIIIAETATTAYYNWSQADDAHKNQWLIENYDYLAAQPNVVGVFYFNINGFDGYNCDFKIDKYKGYGDALKNPTYQYLSGQGLGNLGK